MYAVIETGGKQYRVELGSEIQVDRLDAQPGDSITLDRVLLVADDGETTVGRPVVEGASVSARILGQERGEKIVVFKYKQKARTRVKKGFRAELTTIRIADIALGGRSAARDAESSESKKAQAAKDAEKAAAAKAAADRELAAKLAAAIEQTGGEEAAVAALPTATAEAKPAEAKPAEAKPAEAKRAAPARTSKAKAAEATDAAGPGAAAPADAHVETGATPQKASSSVVKKPLARKPPAGADGKGDAAQEPATTGLEPEASKPASESDADEAGPATEPDSRKDQ